jgi:membrane protein required for beta-lactamase induction
MMGLRTQTRGLENGGTMLGRIYTGVAVILLGAVIVGWVTTAGDVRVNTAAIAEACRRGERYEQLAEKQASEIAEVTAELRAIKAILERMEKQLEAEEQ